MATDNEIKAAGFQLPLGTDYIQYGDDAITANARETYKRTELLRDRVTVEAAGAMNKVDSRGEIAGGFVAANFRPTWLSFTSTGDIPESTVKKIQKKIGINEYDTVSSDRSIRAVYANYRGTNLGGSQPTAAQAPTRVTTAPRIWAHYGDSLTQLGSPEALAALTGYTHTNAGISGNTSTQAAIRAGAAVYQIRLSAPVASTDPVTVSEHYPTNLAMNTWSYPVVIAGTPGALQNTGGTVKFTPAVAPAEPIPEGWHQVKLGDFQQGATALASGASLIIGLGRNDLNLGQPLEQLIVNIRKIISASPAAAPNYLIWGIPPWRTEPLGSPARVKLNAWNAALAAAFPGHFVEPAIFLRTDEAFTAAGVPKTEQDAADIAQGLTPETFRRDADGHFSTAGNKAWAHYMNKELEKRGWKYV